MDTQQELPKDGGAIYVLGEQRGGRIENNYVDSVGANIYPDDGSAYWTIKGNVLHPRPGPGKAAQNGAWLFVWPPRCHDLTIAGNYTGSAKETNKGTNTEDADTHVENPFSAPAQKIISAAGLEPAYKDIAEE